MAFKETKKWRVVNYIRVNVPVEEDVLYSTPEFAHIACTKLQDENVHMVEEVNDVERI